MTTNTILHNKLHLASSGPLSDSYGCHYQFVTSSIYKRDPPNIFSLGSLFLSEILQLSWLSTPFLLAEKANLTIGGSCRSHHLGLWTRLVLQATSGDLVFSDSNASPMATGFHTNTTNSKHSFSSILRRMGDFLLEQFCGYLPNIVMGNYQPVHYGWQTSHWRVKVLVWCIHPLPI